jgi:hypothetical protein
LIYRRAVAEFMFVLPADTLGTAFMGQRLGGVFPLWQIRSDTELPIANDFVKRPSTAPNPETACHKENRNNGKQPIKHDPFLHRAWPNEP